MCYKRSKRPSDPSDSEQPAIGVNDVDFEWPSDRSSPEKDGAASAGAPAPPPRTSRRSLFDDSTTDSLVSPPVPPRSAASMATPAPPVRRGSSLATVISVTDADAHAHAHGSDTDTLRLQHAGPVESLTDVMHLHTPSESRAAHDSSSDTDVLRFERGSMEHLAAIREDAGLSHAASTDDVGGNSDSPVPRDEEEETETDASPRQGVTLTLDNRDTSDNNDNNNDNSGDSGDGDFQQLQFVENFGAPYDDMSELLNAVSDLDTMLTTSGQIQNDMTGMLDNMNAEEELNDMINSIVRTEQTDF